MGEKSGEHPSGRPSGPPPEDWGTEPLPKRPTTPPRNPASTKRSEQELTWVPKRH